MSFQSAVAKLGSPVKELVLSVTQESILLGKTEKDQSEVAEWIEKVGQGELVKETNFKVCEDVFVSLIEYPMFWVPRI